MDGYNFGQKPPGLAKDGSFDTPFGRLFSLVDDNGRSLSVDPETSLLKQDAILIDDPLIEEASGWRD